jgi:hypothetical protein
MDYTQLGVCMHAVRRIALLALALGLSSLHAQNIFNCSSGFSNAGSAGPGSNLCAVAVVGEPASNWALAGSVNSSFSGTSVITVPAGQSHNVVSMIYQTPVNVQAFTAKYLFIPNGQTVSFALQNNNNPNVDGGSTHMVGGAGGEAGIFQAFGTLPPAPNNLWAIVFDSYSPLTNSGSFSYSGTQMYMMNELPALPSGNGDIDTFPTNHISTSPVPLNSPASTVNTSTGDTYSATITYDGSTVVPRSILLYQHLDERLNPFAGGGQHRIFYDCDLNRHRAFLQSGNRRGRVYSQHPDGNPRLHGLQRQFCL